MYENSSYLVYDTVGLGFNVVLLPCACYQFGHTMSLLQMRRYGWICCDCVVMIRFIAALEELSKVLRLCYLLH
jgi:hypothetical protein